MFVGHYGPSFLAKRSRPSIPLYILFLAVQLLDIFWAIFVFLGVERVRIVPGFTETNALDLYYMPYTHSLPAALGWSIAAAVAYGWLASQKTLLGADKNSVAAIERSKQGAVVGAAVFSHWPLDFLVHRPDLALYDNAAKVGLGLWDYPFLTLGIEGTFLLGAMALYMARSRTLTRRASFSIPVFCCLILLMQAGMLYGPPPPSDRAMAMTGLTAYALLAAAIAWLERGRAGRGAETDPRREKL